MVLLLRYVVDFWRIFLLEESTSQGSKVSKNPGFDPFSECSL